MNKSKPYRAIVRVNGIGKKATLYKKFLGLWWPTTSSQAKSGYNYMVNENIAYWVSEFDVEIIYK